MKRVHVILVALVLYSACIRMQRPARVGLYRAAPPSPRCRQLASRVLWLNLSATGSGALGGAASAGSAAFTGKLQWGAAGVAAGLTFTSAITGYVATWTASKFSSEGCAQ